MHAHREIAQVVAEVDHTQEPSSALIQWHLSSIIKKDLCEEVCILFTVTEVMGMGFFTIFQYRLKHYGPK